MDIQAILKQAAIDAAKAEQAPRATADSPKVIVNSEQPKDKITFIDQAGEVVSEIVNLAFGDDTESLEAELDAEIPITDDTLLTDEEIGPSGGLKAGPFTTVPLSTVLGPTSASTPPRLSVTIPATAHMTNGSEEGLCQHLCKKCNKWWTHGDAFKCRYPDVKDQGPCINCLNGEPSTWQPESEFTTDANGKLVLTIQHQVETRNKTRIMCKDMNVEQLTYHILFTEKRIEELRVHGLEARKMRQNLEEEELDKVPEDQREAFRQALRNGGKKKTRVAKEPKEKKETDKAKIARLTKELVVSAPFMDASLIAKWMVTTGKSQQQVEENLYGD